MILGLPGHAEVETTARSARLAQESERDSAIRVLDSIEASAFADSQVAEPDAMDGPGRIAGTCFLPPFGTPFAFR